MQKESDHAGAADSSNSGKDSVASINHTEEIDAMSKPVEELHNREDATSLMDGLKLFLVVFFLLGVLGTIFWSAF
jgi:hypothetical protein